MLRRFEKDSLHGLRPSDTRAVEVVRSLWFLHVAR